MVIALKLGYVESGPVGSRLRLEDGKLAAELAYTPTAVYRSTQKENRQRGRHRHDETHKNSIFNIQHRSERGAIGGPGDGSAERSVAVSK